MRMEGRSGSSRHSMLSELRVDELLALVAKLNQDNAVQGILVQLPLPPQIDSRAVLEAGFACAVLPPEKIARRIASRTEDE